MKNLILIFGLIIFLASCGNKKAEDKVSKVSIPAPVAKVDAKLEFADPARVGGSSFGEFFISMIKTQNFDMALKFTSKESIDNFGSDVILNKYREFKYNYKLNLASINKEGNVYKLQYTTNEYATGKFKTMTVVVENDTCKLVLPEKIEDFLK